MPRWMGNWWMGVLLLTILCSWGGVAAGFNAPISGVFFAVESVLQRPGVVKDADGSPMSADSSGASFSSALTVAMVLLASVVAAVVSQVGFPVPGFSSSFLAASKVWPLFVAAIVS